MQVNITFLFYLILYNIQYIVYLVDIFIILCGRDHVATHFSFLLFGFICGEHCITHIIYSVSFQKCFQHYMSSQFLVLLLCVFNLFIYILAHRQTRVISLSILKYVCPCHSVFLARIGPYVILNMLQINCLLLYLYIYIV